MKNNLYLRSAIAIFFRFAWQIGEIGNGNLGISDLGNFPILGTCSLFGRFADRGFFKKLLLFCISWLILVTVVWRRILVRFMENCDGLGIEDTLIIIFARISILIATTMAWWRILINNRLISWRIAIIF